MKKIRLLNAFLVVLAVAGMTGVASAEPSPDFNFTIEPSNTVTVIPGQTSSFLIAVSTVGGFTNPVTFSVSNLPAGVTASFSPNPITPPGDVLMTLTASNNATTGSNISIYITGAGGGITNTTTGSVSVEFGLVPICYGAYEGQITDSVTGNPVPYAVVAINTYSYITTADANGNYIITNISLSGSDNQPENYDISSYRSNYWTTYTNAYAVCDTTNIVNIAIEAQVPGSMSGTVKTQGGQPLTNFTVTASDYQNSYYTNTDINGAFSFASVLPGNDNVATTYTVTAEENGYWSVSSNVTVQANSNTVVDLIAIPICYASVSGKVIYAGGQPATNIYVTVGTTYVYTDANGNYTVTNLTLNNDNTPIYVGATAEATSGYYAASTNLTLTNCGEAGVMGTLVLNPVPVLTNNYGAITGQVFDIQTSNALGGVEVYSLYYGFYAYTDSNGFYSISNVLVGTDSTTNLDVGLYTSTNGYFQVISNVEVYANETSTQDFYILRQGYGYIDGTVVDSVTGQPLQGVYLSLNGTSNTGPEGLFSSGPIALNSGNTPTFEDFSVQKAGYWQTNVYAYVTNGMTNNLTIPLLQVCTGATILGKVVNADTQAPITNAQINIYGEPTSFTDANGNFIVTNITVGNDNSPSEVTVEASASGYITQYKTVTIFCGASINTEFGVPETVFGAIQGYVTNEVTGAPLTNVFIGSSFGAATNTDTNGYYFLGQVPILVSNQTWTVTADPTAYGFPAQTKTTMVSSNTTNEVDFGFGGPTTLGVTSQQTFTNGLGVGTNLQFTVTLTNGSDVASNVVLVDTLPPSVLYVGSTISPSTGPFSTPLYSNGTVTTMATSFNAGAELLLYITVTPTNAGNLTNLVSVSSTSPLTTNSVLGATNMNVANTNAPTITTNYADLAIGATGVPNPVAVDGTLTYNVAVTNLGPSDAPAVYVTNTFPSSVTVTLPPTLSQGSYTYNASTKVLIWNVGDMPFEGPTTATATFVVTPMTAGEIEFTATAAINWLSTDGEEAVVDPNISNNNAEVFTEVIGESSTNGLQWGSVIFNPQTGLFDQTVTYDNTSDFTESNILVEVLDLPPKVRVYNATGTNEDGPYVGYNQPVLPTSNVVFLVEYYEASRVAFNPTNFAVIVNAVLPVVSPPTGLNTNAVTVQFYSEGNVTIEFPSRPGHTYVVEYSTSITGPWSVATPPIVAVNSRTQWIDSGPPVTTSPPANTNARYYQIVETK